MQRSPKIQPFHSRLANKAHADSIGRKDQHDDLEARDWRDPENPVSISTTLTYDPRLLFNLPEYHAFI